MMAVFACLTFTFVACSDDDNDDEPNNNSGSITLTLDGKKYTFDSGVSTFDLDEIVIELFNSNRTPWISFVIYEPSELSDGMVLTSDMEGQGMGPIVLGVINYNGLWSGGYTLESGSVRINSINLNTRKLKVTFNNAIFKEFIYGKESVNVNGSFSISLNSQWGSAY